MYCWKVYYRDRLVDQSKIFPKLNIGSKIIRELENFHADSIAWKLNLFKESLEWRCWKKIGKKKSEKRIYKSLRASGLYIGCNIRIRGYTNFKRFSRRMLRFNTFHFIQFEHFLFEFLRISCETWKIFVIIETNICYI